MEKWFGKIGLFFAGLAFMFASFTFYFFMKGLVEQEEMARCEASVTTMERDSYEDGFRYGLEAGKKLSLGLAEPTSHLPAGRYRVEARVNTSAAGWLTVVCDLNPRAKKWERHHLVFGELIGALHEDNTWETLPPL